MKGHGRTAARGWIRRLGAKMTSKAQHWEWLTGSGLRGLKPAMAEQQMHSWTVYHIAAKLKLVGTIHDAPNAQTAIERAIEEYQVPPNKRGTLFALRRD